MIKKEITALEDKETVWNKSLYHIGDHYEMCTTDKNDMYRYCRLAEKYPDDVKIINDDKYSMTFSLSMSGGTLAWRPKRKRIMSDEQKKAAADRLRSSREKKTAENTILL